MSILTLTAEWHVDQRCKSQLSSRYDTISISKANGLGFFLFLYLRNSHNTIQLNLILGLVVERLKFHTIFHISMNEQIKF